jgi:hypothetical protein
MLAGAGGTAVDALVDLSYFSPRRDRAEGGSKARPLRADLHQTYRKQKRFFRRIEMRRDKAANDIWKKFN